MTMFYGGPSSVAYKGEVMSWTLAIVAMILALLSGCFLTADSLSSEKREGTLGLLFLTSLRGIDVVLGKMAASRLTTLFGVLAVIPAFFLPLLNGGVPLAETCRVVLAIVVAFVFSLSIGMFISAIAVESRKAVIGALFVLIPLVTMPVLWVMVANEFLNLGVSYIGVPRLSPGMLLLFARDDFYTSPWGHLYWRSLGIFLFLSLLLLLATSVYLPRSVNRVSAAGRVGVLIRHLFRRRHVAESRRRLFRPGDYLESANPYFEMLINRIRLPFWTKLLPRLCVGFYLVMVLWSFFPGGDKERLWSPRSPPWPYTS